MKLNETFIMVYDIAHLFYWNAEMCDIQYIQCIIVCYRNICFII